MTPRSTFTSRCIPNDRNDIRRQGRILIAGRAGRRWPEENLAAEAPTAPPSTAPTAPAARYSPRIFQESCRTLRIVWRHDLASEHDGGRSRERTYRWPGLFLDLVVYGLLLLLLASLLELASPVGI
jgi:hypothetical protein